MPATAQTWLLEASWEVCNKVGGIHTVIVSKLPTVLQEYGEQYLSIGPWLGNQPEFNELPIPQDWDGLAITGVTLHYGEWQVPGRPKAVLLEWQGLIPRSNEFKALFWERFQLDTLGSDFYDFDQPLLWGVATGLFTAAFAQRQQVTLQLHEWLSAGAALVAKPSVRLRTVFTTHATVLGRALASRNVPIYDRLEAISPDASARECGVLAKHQLERLGAKLAGAFTTVSHLTAEEASAFLGRVPDVVTENGLALHELPPLLGPAAATRSKLELFVSDYFAPSYPFDPSRCQWQVTDGRPELHNKGYDLYLQALAGLNGRLKQGPAAPSVLAILFVAAGNRGIRQEELTKRLLRAEGQRRKIAELTAYQEVPISPYVPDPNDPIPALAYDLGLRNRIDDRVKLLYMPAYFDGLDGLLNADLYDLVAACDVGVFPSFYEPWGYTPLESIALGVPAVTSDLAGFGQAADNLPGIRVLERRSHDDGAAAAQLTDMLQDSLKWTPRELESERIAAYQSAGRFSWDRLYANYQRAYEIAWQ